MPWCPKCKNEYKEGITVCADCGEELVESLETKVPVCFGKEEDIYEMIEFLKANKISVPEIRPAKEEGLIELFATEKEVVETKKAIQVYLQHVAMERAKNAGVEEEECSGLFPQKRNYENKVYESADSKAENYRSGAYTLIIVGLLGIIVLVLINLGVIPILLPSATKTMLNIVLGGMLIIFVIMGIVSAKTAKQLEAKAEGETNKKDDIIAYVKENWSDEAVAESQESEEMVYFQRAEAIRNMITNYSPDIAEDFKEYLVEELYTELFESDK